MYSCVAVVAHDRMSRGDAAGAVDEPLTLGQVNPWQPRGDRHPIAGWVMLPLGMNDDEWLRWTQKALDSTRLKGYSAKC